MEDRPFGTGKMDETAKDNAQRDKAEVTTIFRNFAMNSRRLHGVHLAMGSRLFEARHFLVQVDSAHYR